MRQGSLWNRVLLCLLLLGCSKHEVPASETQLIKVPRAAFSAELAERLNFYSDHLHHPTHLIGYADSEGLSLLSPNEHTSIEVLDEVRWASGGYDPVTLQEHSNNYEPMSLEGYHNYQALTAELQRIQAAHPDLVRLASAGKSVEGRELWYVVLSDQVNVNEHEPKFIYHANMHGDEVVGRELMIYLLRHLLDQYQKDARITQIIDQSELFIMPSMNPDGFERGTRGNADGRDLNRNFPDRFTSTSDTPRGRQIEVQHMMRLAEENHFVYGINWHGGEICFNLPWGNIRNRPENKYWDDAMFYEVGREYTRLNPPMYANHHDSFDHGLTYGYEWYPVNGGINDWFNYYRRSVHSVVELSVTKRPSSSKLQGFWDSNREAMITYLWRGLRGLHLQVQDEQGQILLNPVIAISSAPGRKLRFDNGWVHRLTGDGTQTVTVTVEGYKPMTLQLDATYFDGNYTPVVMQKSE